MATNTDAHRFAAEAHSGQLDKGGAPYIRHINRVAGATTRRVGHAVNTDGLPLIVDDVIQAACLHDVVEDSPTTLADLAAAGFAEPVVEMVRLLSKTDEGMSYAERIDALIESRNLGAILIKISDNEDNAGVGRPPPAGNELAARYAASLPRLREAAAALGYTGS